jgi:hypothetical protein
LSRESVWLIALAVAGTALKIPLGIWFKPLFHSELGYRFLSICCQVGLVCMVPFAVRLNSELGLLGAPFIAAKRPRQTPPGRFRSLIRIALRYDLAAIAVSILAIAVLALSGMLGSSVPGSAASYRAAEHTAVAAHVGRFVVAGAMAAIGAGLNEEIMFRLSAFAILIWLFRLLLSERTDRPSRTALWCATIMQGYAFGLLHLMSRSAILPKIRVPILIAGLAAPQTWAGIVFGRLYLRHGLEASMIAHVMMDLVLTLFAASILYLIGLSTPQSGVSVRALIVGYG